MRLTSVRIRNYRLLVDAELEVDSATTLIVGRNNTAKTSLFNFIKGVLEGGPFSFDDYPLWKHKGLCDSLNEYAQGKLSFDDLRHRWSQLQRSFVLTIPRKAMRMDWGHCPHSLSTLIQR